MPHCYANDYKLAKIGLVSTNHRFYVLKELHFDTVLAAFFWQIVQL